MDSLELVLLYCSFLSLKARNALTLQIAPEEYMLRSEHKLFQAYVRNQACKLVARANGAVAASSTTVISTLSSCLKTAQPTVSDSTLPFGTASFGSVPYGQLLVRRCSLTAVRKRHANMYKSRINQPLRLGSSEFPAIRSVLPTFNSTCSASNIVSRTSDGAPLEHLKFAL